MSQKLGNRFNTKVELLLATCTENIALTLCIKRGLANTETVNTRSAYIGSISWHFDFRIQLVFVTHRCVNVRTRAVFKSHKFIFLSFYLFYFIFNLTSLNSIEFVWNFFMVKKLNKIFRLLCAVLKIRKIVEFECWLSAILFVQKLIFGVRERQMIVHSYNNYTWHFLLL